MRIEGLKFLIPLVFFVALLSSDGFAGMFELVLKSFTTGSFGEKNIKTSREVEVGKIMT